MLVSGDLGFSSLILVVCLVFPVIGLVIRRQWRLAVARKEEVRKLLIFASEEATRAELEASVGYGVVSVSGGYHCAVCYCPTTTRCARCKAVRYCSGKCQIIHWRQGHKDECHPPSTTFRTNDEGSDSGQKVAEQDQHKIYGDRLGTEGGWLTEPVEATHGESVLSDSSTPLEVPYGNTDDIKVEFHSDKEGADSTAESSWNSFSGFSASPTSTESSDDVSFFESISSNGPERSDEPLSADISGDTLETNFIVNDVVPTKPLSPKFTHLVESVDSFAKLNKSSQIKSGGGGESRCISSGSLGLDTSCRGEGSVVDRPTVSSGFWGRTFEPITDAYNDCALSKSSGACNSNLSESGSSLRFSFSLSGNTSPLCAQGSEVKSSISDDALPVALGSNKPTDRVALSGINTKDSSNVRNSPSCERSTHVEKDSTTGGSHVSGSKEIKPSSLLSSSSSCVHAPSSVEGISISRNAFYISSPSSSCSESNNKVNDNGTASHPLKSGEVRQLSPSVSDDHLYSSSGKHSAPSAKSGKVAGRETSTTVISQITSSPNGRNGLKTSVLKVVDQVRGSKLLKHCPVAVGSEAVGRCHDKALFSYESFVKFYNWNKMELQPCGLINCGNSCYANAVFQCLAFTPPLTAYFLQGIHSRACTKKEWCFTCEFENLILKAKEGKSPVSPSGILSQLQNIGSQLGNGREEDAHEFLRYAIDTMQSVCPMEAGVIASGSLEREETTLIGLTFGGYLRSKIKCMKCQGKSERHERMMDLAVEIDGDIGTLEEALRRFTGTEILDGENKYQCGRCKSYEKAKKKLTILEAPNVLTIALKRFQSGKFGKLNKSIRFPEILDLAPYMSGTSDKSPIYRLYGVVVHLDIMNASFSGHYVCYVKNIQNKWFKIDDSVVTATELEKVLTKGAYMLLYARCSPRAPRLIRNRIVFPSRVNGKSITSQSKSASAHPGVVQFNANSNPLDGPASIESFYSKFRRLQSILEDSSSDSSSLISSNSDEGSCSTDSTRDSTSTDDFSDFRVGDLGRGWNSPWRNFSDSDTSSSSSSSPLYSSNSSLAESDQYASGLPRTSGCRTDAYVSESTMESIGDRPCCGSSRLVDLEGKGNDPFLHSDTTTRQCRKLGKRETDPERLGRVNPLKDVKSGAYFRKSMRERTE